VVILHVGGAARDSLLSQNGGEDGRTVGPGGWKFADAA